MSINIVKKIDDFVKINKILISVSDKTGLDNFIPKLIQINPDIKILSTGGTYKKLKKILENNKSNIIQVSDFTGQPETQGGLVKTLDFKIHLGLLTETYNDSHQSDLKRTNSFPIDMAVVNLYPFSQTILQHATTFEHARGNIDIGGPCMIRSAAKNFIRVASVVEPFDYDMIIAEMENNNCMLSLKTRFNLAKKAFKHTANFDCSISDYLNSQSFDLVKNCYNN